MKRILLISHDASLTGAPKSILLIGKRLKSCGYEIHWIVGKPGPRNESFEENATRYWRVDLSKASIVKKIKFRLLGGMRGHQQKIISWVKCWDPDLIINNTVVNGDILEALSPLNKKVISRIPEMQSVMAFYDTFNQSTSKVFKYSDKIVAASNAVKDQIIQNWNQTDDKVAVIYSGSDIKPLPKENHDVFTVSSCGSLISRKGIDLFLLVAQECKRQGENNIKFQWIGANTKSLGYFEVIEDIRKLELNETVKIIPVTKDVRPYLAISDVFLMTSKEDPFPIVNLEALKHGLPVISFEKSGGTEDIVKRGLGISVPYLNIKKMADEILKIKQSPIDLNISDVEKIFSVDEMVVKWDKLIKNFN